MERVSILTAPLWAAMSAATDRLVRGDAGSLQAFAVAVRRYAGPGLRLGLAAGTAATAFRGTATVLPDHRWLLVPHAADGAVMVVLLLAGLSAFSLTSGGLRGWPLVRPASEAGATNRTMTATAQCADRYDTGGQTGDG
ncbi:hypothetical protein ABN034_12215 [Actinopolymorpha sp. B11F2]|uniref:hypothetical protein n=1 Tax=Actinopolymorpha sp. B11F2 TaxID=3160862 RepID=UPI0032E440A5